MSERDKFDHILVSLHEATLDDARWPAASGLIDDVLGTEGNALTFGAGILEEDIQIFSTGVFFRGLRHRELEREYFEVYYPLDERVPRVRVQPDSQPVHITTLYTDQELKSSPVYNELLVPNHVGNSINVRLDGPNGTRIIWEVGDPIDRDGWSSTKLEMIQRLLPHIRQYVSVRHVLSGAEALGASLAELLENTRQGIIQLDSRGRIVATNDRALNLLRTGDGLLDNDGYLFAHHSADNTDLQKLLKDALPPYGQQGISDSMTVRRLATSQPLVLHVNPVDKQQADCRSWPVVALVLVVDPRSDTRIDPDLVAESLGLTPMESRVAVMMAEGKAVREIAAATGRKESTIRWHVRHIYAKHGISRQAELVRLVLSMAGVPNAGLE